jgi:hypothetical protein
MSGEERAALSCHLGLLQKAFGLTDTLVAAASSHPSFQAGLPPTRT